MDHPHGDHRRLRSRSRRRGDDRGPAGPDRRRRHGPRHRLLVLVRITGVTAHDLRAPTSRTLAGSDAAHADPDYSAAYVVLQTDDPSGAQGEGMTFTIGRGNDLVCDAIDALAHHVVGRDLDELVGDMAGTWRSITSDSQLRWLGPEKGVIHLATAALVNGLWDLW